ncbi:MAG TPA: hypothetical protein VNW68_00040 [Candidatus Limnocylindria bacterium]|jgi:uncharacterized membrane-anchored protein YitT (DUF2179 family)|nr:hypothetical protein [Candidatus Limnocylindria bacterium]
MTEPRDRAVVTESRAEPAIAVAAASTGSAPHLRWGPIWAGVLTAFGLLFLFSLIALAGGLAVVEFNGQPTAGRDWGWIATIITGALLVVAFFAGGFVSSWAGWEADEGLGLLNGFLVWALALVLLLLFAALGIGQAFGAAGQLFAGQFAPGQVLPPDVDPQQVADAFGDAAWQTLFAIVLALAAAVLGGLVGTRDQFHERWPYTRRSA